LPRRDRSSLWVILAGAFAAVGFVLLALTVARDGQTGAPVAAAPAPAVVVVPAVPAPSTTPAPAVATAPAPQKRRERDNEQRFARNDRSHVPANWVSGFYPIYGTASDTFGVNWLLLASIHKQETAFSTHPTTYHGLNFARCCAGPMQFNVTNGPPSTWGMVRDAHLRAARPQAYNHVTDHHPSVYDDFDAIMAAADLLRLSGAGGVLDATAWRAAYDYYGHDLTGVDYASQVVARAIGWGRARRMCINCETDPNLLAVVDAAWGAPVRAELIEAERRAAEEKPARARVAEADR
jgi:hypothetical protein